MSKTFITYHEALQILEENKANFPVVTVSIHDAGGCVLAEDLVADRDFPPYDRVTMDGIAISYKAFENGTITLPIQEIAPAGTEKKTLKDSSTCIEVMTGAILPDNTDTVIRYEDLEINEDTASLKVDNLKKNQNIHFKGMDIKKATVIKKAGQKISSAEINIAAAIGKDTIQVIKMPKFAIVSTGDELVDVHEIPKTHQIRRSSVYGIKNTLKEWHVPVSLHHLLDDKQAMKASISKLLIDFDVLVFTGGVSKGKYDFLPEVLLELSVENHFHKIKQRPGKPMWFGTKGADTYVFGLPGNPVSTFACLYTYIRFWLMQSLKLENTVMYAALSEDVQFKPELVYFLEASLQYKSNGTIWAQPHLGNGSGDFINLVHTDGFLVLPQEKTHFKKGEVYPFIPYRNKQ